MMKLIRQVKVYAPEYLGVKDVLVSGGQICAIDNSIRLDTNVEVEVIDGSGKLLTPGFIDCHVHIIGGGGEGGYKTRTPEVTLTDITLGGVTTVIGTLGTDGVSRDGVSLLAKARALEEEGISTFMYTGSYRIPAVTITGDLMKDIITIDKIIGAGEIALSDHRSSQPSFDEFARLTADVRVGGMLSGKAGVINIHMGDGKRMVDFLLRIAEETEIPITQFVPTHMNRNPYLFEEAKRYAKSGGYIDFTTSSDPIFWEEGEVKASKALKLCIESGVAVENITFSSDGGGSLPAFDEKGNLNGLTVGKVVSLFAEVRDAVSEDGVELSDALRVITSNPASIFKLKNKGHVATGMDADLVLLSESDLTLDTVFAKGQIMVRDGKAVVRGTFEK